MTIPPKVLVNPVSGEEITITESGADNGGRLLAFDLRLPPGAHVPARHTHPLQEERFTVLEGQIEFRLGRRRMVLGAGERVVIPRRASHWFGNRGPAAALAHVEVRPALRTEELFEATEEAAREGRLRARGLRRVALLARLVLEYRREASVPHVPEPLVQMVLRPLAWFARR